MIDAELRPGSGDTIFMICGAGGAAEELDGLAHAFDGDPRVIALVPVPAGDDVEAATTVEAMAAAAADLIRARQPSGPYRLLGYSLGGLIALETGRILREAGEAVSFLGLVDALFDQRYWPGRLFVRASIRRMAVHVRALLGKPRAQAWAELRERSRSLTRRVRGRLAPQHSDDSQTAMTVEAANLAAMARWRPRIFEGPIVLFSADGTDFGCDLGRLWRPWLPDMKVRSVSGGHLELVRDPRGIDRLAKAVEGCL